MTTRARFLEFNVPRRETLLRDFGAAVASNIVRPDVAGNIPIRLQPDARGSAIAGISGPRVAALEILAGVDAGRLLKLLGADDCALVRQLIPWDFGYHNPAVYMHGRRVRIEVPWPDELQQSDIPLAKLGQCPADGRRFIAGLNEHGATVRVGLSDSNAHILISGQTGSGKSWAMRSVAAQLSQNDRAQLVLIDGKWGDGLGILNGLQGQVGPIAVEREDVIGALYWTYVEMRRRYQESEQDPPPLTVVFDEFQEFTRGAQEPAIIELLRRIGSQGRAANVHLVAGTQHPTVDVFGDNTTRRHFTARIALRVTDYAASEAAVGGPNPRADLHLLGQGDAYVVTSNAVQRVQMAYIPPASFRGYTGGQPQVRAWPVFKAESLGVNTRGRPRELYSPEEYARAIIAARDGVGRPTLQDRLRKKGQTMGGGRSGRLLQVGQTIHAILEADGYCSVAAPE